MKIFSRSLRNTLFGILSMVLIGGCNSWLDIEPENELIKQEFWKTREDVMSVLAATYDAFRETTIKSFLLGEVRADFVSVAQGEFSEYAQIGKNDISRSNSKVGWGEYYNVINLANTLMYYAPEMQKVDNSLSDEELQGIEAEMIFLRSLSYFYLVRLWKDVPLVLSPTISDTVDFYLAKTDERIILDQIVEDLKYASQIAFTDELWGTPYYTGRANKLAIQALLADVMLWKEDYNGCLSYCDSVINEGSLSLASTNDWFDIYYPGNSPFESIFEIQYDDNIEGQENPMYYTMLYNIGVDIPEIAYSTKSPKDLRYINGRGPIWKFFGINESGKASARRSISSGTERDANFIYYRYTDILLIKAEALAELGSFDEAYELLNDVAERANLSSYNVGYSIEEFRTILLGERGREFALEGKRWFDILRFAKKEQFQGKQILIDILLGKAKDANELAIMKTKVIDTMSYYLPVHLEELQRNENLVQNPFYDR